ncbi:LysM domain-containing protein [Flavobacterium oreochromis]|uniref:LysM peptidoglycan-binding domain-containing protein n=1 Tax=Flavobacterium oreochromis TaxID=2906078 RepID=UPI00385F8AF6
MNNNWSRYKVKKGDTLESIAKEIGISHQALRCHHNTYCKKKYLIEYNHLKGIEEILLPSIEELEKLLEFEKKTEPLSNLPLYYLPKNFYKKQYDVEETIQEITSDTFTIHSSIDIEIIDNKNGYIVSFRKKDHELSEDKITLLSLACIKTIYPIEFTIRPQGQIIDINNHSAIIARFKKSKSALLDYYTGEINQEYINKFERNLIDKKTLLKSYCSTLLYQILFPNMSWFSQEDKKDYFYFHPNSYNVECNFSTQYDFENSDYIKTTIKSNYIEGNSFQEILRRKVIEYPNETRQTQEETPSDWIAEIELTYYTSKQNKELIKAQGQVILSNNEVVYMKHTLNLG